MSLFLSRFINSIDKKGRVSIPANYRSLLAAQPFHGIVVYQSIKNDCIEACGIDRLEEMSKLINQLDPYSAERDAFETIILGGAVQLPFDSEGRVVLPIELMELAGIDQKACFVGKGQIFEIWNPDKFEKYSKEAKELAVKNKLLLRRES